MASSNVVAACTAHLARHTTASFASMYGGSATPAAVAAQCGYPGKAASAWRHHLARQHGQGAVRTGHGRYPALTLVQYRTLLGLAAPATPGTAKQASARKARAGKVLWAGRKAQAAGTAQGKRAASKPRDTAQGTPTPAAPAPVQQGS